MEIEQEILNILPFGPLYGRGLRRKWCPADLGPLVIDAIWPVQRDTACGRRDSARRRGHFSSADRAIIYIIQDETIIFSCSKLQPQQTIFLPIFTSVFVLEMLIPGKFGKSDKFPGKSGKHHQQKNRSGTVLNCSRIIATNMVEKLYL